MSFSSEKAAQSPTFGLSASADKLRNSLRSTAPACLAARTDTIYRESGPGAGEFSLSFFGTPIRVTYPELVARSAAGEALPLPLQALLLYYFGTCDGTPPAGKWVSFGDLPDGRIYAQAFQGYSGDKLARQFGSQIAAFQAACLAAGGQPVNGGDAAFSFLALPTVPLCVTYWLGEDEFPSNCKVLFDPAVRSHLPTDVCAILGSMLVSRIIKAGTKVQDQNSQSIKPVAHG